jgi:hypothetical protein
MINYVKFNGFALTKNTLYLSKERKEYCGKTISEITVDTDNPNGLSIGVVLSNKELIELFYPWPIVTTRVEIG